MSAATSHRRQSR
jgi:hypothetical protein